MDTMLDVVNTGSLTEADKNEINEQIDSIISKHKNNRYEINKLVLESVSALTASENYSEELSSKGPLKRFWGGITGKNNELQRKINNNYVVAQYASQQTLQKLAEQNLMSFELITVVNNKLNASMLEVETEINNIYGTLVTFFKKTKSDIVQLENRVERLERNVNLLNWQNSIEYQMWNGMEYVDLDVVSKIVCMVRDFYDITKGEWTTSDLLLLKSAMGIIGINPREVINCGEFIRCLYLNKSLRDKLFQGKMSNESVDEWHVSIASAVNKGVKLQKEENYIVQSVLKCLESNSVYLSDESIVDNLLNEYSKNELFINSQTQILVYDLMVELLYNIEQISYEPKEIQNESTEDSLSKELHEAEEMYLNGLHKEAFDAFLALAEKECGRAMYFLGEYYKFGYGKVVLVDIEKARQIQAKGATLKDPLCKLQLLYECDCNSELGQRIKNEVYPILKKLSEEGDPIAQNEFAEICQDSEEVEYWLTEAAKRGHWKAMHKLGLRHYGKDKSEADYLVAIYYFMGAEERFYADAIGYIGLMYDWGYGFKENAEEAFEWYKLAAESGCVFAMRNVANCYYSGRGCAVDYGEAKQWYTKAAELGYEDAKVQLQQKFDISAQVKKSETEISLNMQDIIDEIFC